MNQNSKETENKSEITTYEFDLNELDFNELLEVRTLIVGFLKFLDEKKTQVENIEENE